VIIVNDLQRDPWSGGQAGVACKDGMEGQEGTPRRMRTSDPDISSCCALAPERRCPPGPTPGGGRCVGRATLQHSRSAHAAPAQHPHSIQAAPAQHQHGTRTATDSTRTAMGQHPRSPQAARGQHLGGERRAARPCCGGGVASPCSPPSARAPAACGATSISAGLVVHSKESPCLVNQQRPVSPQDLIACGDMRTLTACRQHATLVTRLPRVRHVAACTFAS
jgi:hypothetical protein